MTGRYPKGLFFLFATEMWERFSFYGISAVLVLYLTTGLGLPDAQAALTSGAYMAFTFMSLILGGLIADRLLGLRYSVSLGGVLILIGNLVLAWKEALPFVFAGLALVALGTGYLKATVSVMIGKLYADGDPHRDSGYTLDDAGAVAALRRNLAANPPDNSEVSCRWDAYWWWRDLRGTPGFRALIGAR